MTKEIYLAGGCFWGAEAYFARVPGVLDTEVGYANGSTENPSYEEVCRGGTGHAETVRLRYDGDRLSLPFLLELYYGVIDPTSVNRQGGDRGPQYRTGIYYVEEGDRAVIEQSLVELERRLGRPIAVECAPLRGFFPAEDYHQDYLDKNPGGYCHIGKQALEAAPRMEDPARYSRPGQETLRQALTPLQYAVTQENATEPPFDNEYCGETRPGIYVDVTTGQPLFVSTDKFESGCGWPSFTRPIDRALLEEREDVSHGMCRTEVRSRAGGAHLGHVFPDGPQDRGGLRYCINSASLRFVPKGEMERQGYGHLLGLLT